MLHQDILSTRMDPPLFCGPFMQGIRDEMYPARYLFSIGERRREGDSGAVYAVKIVDDVDAPDRHFFIESNYEGPTKGALAEMTYYLDGVYQYDGDDPSHQWEDRPQSPHQHVADKRILDSLEACVSGFSESITPHIKIIKRGGQTYRVTPQGKTLAPSFAPRVA